MLPPRYARHDVTPPRTLPYFAQRLLRVCMRYARSYYAMLLTRDCRRCLRLLLMPLLRRHDYLPLDMLPLRRAVTAYYVYIPLMIICRQQARGNGDALHAILLALRRHGAGIRNDMRRAQRYALR